MNRLRILVSLIACFRAARYFASTVVYFATFSAVIAAPLYGAVQVEVFTTSDMQVESTIPTEIEGLVQDTNLHVYELNGIQSVETDLSANLLSNTSQSKRLALQRIQILDNKTRARLQRSAIGLARAVQYGIDRFPAIVFDGQAVVYGATDLQAALAYYHVWRTEIEP